MAAQLDERPTFVQWTQTVLADSSEALLGDALFDGTHNSLQQLFSGVENCQTLGDLMLTDALASTPENASVTGVGLPIDVLASPLPLGFIGAPTDAFTAFLKTSVFEHSKALHDASPIQPSSNSSSCSSPLSSPYNTPISLTPPQQLFCNIASILPLTPTFAPVLSEAGEKLTSRPKRRREKPNPFNIAPDIPLSRDELLQISSSEFETRVQYLAKQREFCPDEMREISRQRRIVKNREYAQQSRKKKKQLLVGVNVKVDMLEKENEALKDENILLKEEIKQLQLLLKHAQEQILTRSPLTTAQTVDEEAPFLFVDLPQIAPSSTTACTNSSLTVAAAATTSPNVVSPTTSATTKQRKSVTEPNSLRTPFGLPMSAPTIKSLSLATTLGSFAIPNRSVKSTACLLVVLFSFGIFFNIGALDSQSDALPTSGWSSRVLLETEESNAFIIFIINSILAILTLASIISLVAFARKYQIKEKPKTR